MLNMLGFESTKIEDMFRTTLLERAVTSTSGWAFTHADLLDQRLVGVASATG